MGRQVVKNIIAIWIAFLFCVNDGFADSRYYRVEVAEPFLELRTGPGKSFPVFHVVEKGGQVDILYRRMGWFKVRTQDGKSGWTTRSQIEMTIMLDGDGQWKKETLLEHQFHKKGELGFVVGRFNNSSFVGAYGDWRVNNYFSAEVFVSQLNTSVRMTGVNMLTHPFINRRVLPYFSVGAGYMKTTASRLFSGSDVTKATAANATVGLRGYLTRNFILRAYTRRTSVFVDHLQTKKFNEWALGASFSF